MLHLDPTDPGDNSREVATGLSSTLYVGDAMVSVLGLFVVAHTILPVPEHAKKKNKKKG